MGEWFLKKIYTPAMDVTETILIWLSYMSGVGSGEIIEETEYWALHGTSLTRKYCKYLFPAMENVKTTSKF